TPARPTGDKLDPHQRGVVLCGQPNRHGRASRPGETYRHAAGAYPHAPARRGERDPQRPARRQDRRPGRAHAGRLKEKQMDATAGHRHHTRRRWDGGGGTLNIAEITYHLAYLAQKEGFCRILWSRDEILPDFASGDAYRSR